MKSADLNCNNTRQIVILFKGGGIAAIEGKDGTVLWDHFTEKELLAVDTGVFDQSGHAYIVTGGNDMALSFYAPNGEIIKIIETGDRVTSLVVDDVDGGDHIEVVAGVAQKGISTYEFTHTTLDSLALKWNVRTQGVVNAITVADLNRDGKKELVFAGYDCAINAVQDYFYGDKPDIGLVIPLTGENIPPDSIELSLSDEFGSKEMPTSETITLAGESPLFCSDNEALGGDQRAESEQPVAETAASEPSGDTSLFNQEGDREHPPQDLADNKNSQSILGESAGGPQLIAVSDNPKSAQSISELAFVPAIPFEVRSEPAINAHPTEADVGDTSKHTKSVEASPIIADNVEVIKPETEVQTYPEVEIETINIEHQEPKKTTKKTTKKTAKKTSRKAP